MRSTIFCGSCIILLACGCGEKAQPKVPVLRVTGGSMAPTLLGEHFAVTCADCRWNFACDTQDVPGSLEAVCPNCGYAHNTLTASQLRPGDGVKLAGEQPAVPFSRWQMVMFQTDRPAQPWAVKRIAALPGEAWGIRDGDIWIDGKIASKTLEEFRAVAIPVYDDDFWPSKTADLPARWQTRPNTGKWERQDLERLQVSQWHCRPQRHELVWLDYQHWRCVSSGLPRTVQAPLLDNDSYNQKLSREQNEVPDLLLSCDVQLTEESTFVMQLTAGDQVFSWDWHWEKEFLSVRMGDGIPPLTESLSKPTYTSDGFHRLECALVDGHLYGSADGKILINKPWKNKQGQPTPLAVPRAAIAASRGATTVRHLKLSRDIYYLDPQGLGRPWTSSRPLGPDEFALLGDNTAISVDSRQDAPQGIFRAKLKGSLQAAR